MANWRALLHRVPGYLQVRSRWSRWRERRAIDAWFARGRPLPTPQALKVMILRHLVRRYRLRSLIETGTYHGDTVAALRPELEQVTSIELHPDLHTRAQCRFARDPRITILHGSSAELMPTLGDRLRAACLIWLDGHYSGPGTGGSGSESPLARELAVIVRHLDGNQVVAIDDVRFFGRHAGYPHPRHIDALFKAHAPTYRLLHLHDMLLALPAGG